MTKRGLTLVEVLAATVLLSLIAAAIVPTLARCLAVLPHQSIDDGYDIARVADAFLTDSKAFGFENEDWVLTADRFEVPWPGELSQSQIEPIQVQVIRSAAENIDHVWLAFRSGEQAALRWMKLPPKPKGDTR